MSIPSGVFWLNLDDGSGYPCVQLLSTARGRINTPSIGAGQMSIFAYVNPQNGGDIITQDEFAGTFRLSRTNFAIAPNGITPNNVSVSAAANTWTDVVVTYSNLYTTNNLKSYSGGTLFAQASAAAFVNNAAANVADVGNFQFGDQHLLASLRALAVQYAEYQASDATALHSIITTYYSTPLPDSLSAINQIGRAHV